MLIFRSLSSVIFYSWFLFKKDTACPHSCCQPTRLFQVPVTCMALYKGLRGTPRNTTCSSLPLKFIVQLGILVDVCVSKIPNQYRSQIAILNESARHGRAPFSFTESVNTRHLVCVRHYSRHVGYNSEHNIVPVQSTYSSKAVPPREGPGSFTG